MFASNNLWAVVAGVIVMIASVEVTFVVAQPNTTKNGAARLQEVQEELLDVVGNSTVSAKNVADLMAVFHSHTGKYMGRLLLEGIMLGAAQKDTWGLLANFWTQLQGRLSPELQGMLKDYREFLGGFDIRTLPLILEQIFKKDALGNSIAGMPMGQLVDIVQPTASKYGVDIKAFMNSIMGKGANNARDLIFAALENFNVTALLSQFLKNTSSNEVQVADTEPMTGGGRPKNEEEKARKARKETLRLFRPIVATFMRENKIDLDPDAVLQVLSPLLTPQVLVQAAPLLSTLALQAGDGFAPLLASVLKGGERNREQMAGFTEGLSALLAGGPNQNMDISTLITMASMFISGGTKRNKDEAKASIPTKETGSDKSILADLAGKLAEGNFDHFLLRTVSSLLAQNTRSPQKSKELLISEVQEDSGGLHHEANSPEAEEASAPKRVYRQRQITDVIEPVLLAMQADEQRNRKINDFILLSKNLINKNFASLGGMIDDIRNLAAEAGIPAEAWNTEFLFKEVKWAKIFEGLLNKEKMRQSLIETMAPTLSKVIDLISSNTQERLYEYAAMKIRTLLLPYGLHGITFDTFPERVAPMVKLMIDTQKLPINPATLLVQLRDYIGDLIEWISAGLTDLHDQPTRKELERVVRVSMKKVGDRIASVAEETREANPACLPLVICRLNTGLNPTTLATAVTRAASLYFATQPALEDSDPSLLLRVVQAASGKVENCEQDFGDSAECKDLYYTARDEEDEYMTYEHQEL